MNCSDVKAQLPLFLGADQNEIDQPELRRHLAGCADCRQAWQELRQIGQLLAASPEPAVRVDVGLLYRRAATRQARTAKNWRWLGLAASFLLVAGLGWSLFGRLEIRLTGQELAIRWGAGPTNDSGLKESGLAAHEPPPTTDRREEQLEMLSAMVRAMVQELQTVDMRQRQDRADMDIRVSGMQEQSLKRWLALQKDLEALYVLTQKGD